jgi:sec-independent protein translocase protein TatA
MKFGPLELWIIAVIILIIFGVGRLPQIGASLGKSIRAFKQGQAAEEAEEEPEPEPKPRRRAAKGTPSSRA